MKKKMKEYDELKVRDKYKKMKNLNYIIERILKKPTYLKKIDEHKLNSLKNYDTYSLRFDSFGMRIFCLFKLLRIAKKLEKKFLFYGIHLGQHQQPNYITMNMMII